MRYIKTEQPYILGRFSSGDTVNVSMYNLLDDSKVVDSESATEVGTTGYFKYHIVLNPAVKTEYLYLMSTGTDEHAGKIILGGYPEEIKTATDKMTFSGNEIQAKVTDKGVLNNPPSENIDDYKATGFATENPPSQNLDDYKATGFSVPHEYDTQLANIQADLDNPDQYKADVSAIPTNPLLANDSRLDKIDQIKAALINNVSIITNADKSYNVIVKADNGTDTIAEMHVSEDGTERVLL